MNYNFFADKTDKIKILDFIFKETDLKIFESDSEYEKEIIEYKTTQEIENKIDLINGDKFAVTFLLWSVRHKGKPIFRKINLNPKKCEGHTFRFTTTGWGMIQLIFGGQKNGVLNQSTLSHFNEKGAMKWEGTNSFNGKVNQWNWVEIQRTSRKLKYMIHTKMAVKKVGSFGVLEGANDLGMKGIEFR